MGKLVTFRCAGIEFDVYDSERVPVGLSECKYFITPDKIKLVEQWSKINGIDKVRTAEQMHTLISVKLIGVY